MALQRTEGDQAGIRHQRGGVGVEEWIVEPDGMQRVACIVQQIEAEDGEDTGGGVPAVGVGPVFPREARGPGRVVGFPRCRRGQYTIDHLERGDHAAAFAFLLPMGVLLQGSEIAGQIRSDIVPILDVSTVEVAVDGVDPDLDGVDRRGEHQQERDRRPDVAMSHGSFSRRMPARCIEDLSPLPQTIVYFCLARECEAATREVASPTNIAQRTANCSNVFP